MRTCSRCGVLVMFLGMLGHGFAFAAATEYPAKPVRVVVGYAPGGGADIMGRLAAERLTESLGQQFVVDNRPGAGQNIGSEHVARSAPDGYTLLMSSSALGINVSLYPKINYDPVRDFAPITIYALSPNLMLVHPSMPDTTVKGFITLARQRPGAINYSSSGSGSTQHLAAELLALNEKLKFTHVPYKGSAPSMTALVGGEVDFSFTNIPSSINFVKAGRLRALAITKSTRSPLLPDVPTMSEAGVPEFEVTVWYGLLAPAGTPAVIVDRINAAAVQSLKSDAQRTKLAQLGAEPWGSSPAEFAKYLGREIEQWGRVVKASGARAE